MHRPVPGLFLECGFNLSSKLPRLTFNAVISNCNSKETTATAQLHVAAKDALEHPPFPAVTAADHNVAETYIMFWTWRTTADTHHASDENIREAVKHVSCSGRGNSRTVLPVGQDDNHNIMTFHLAQGIIVVILLVHFSRALVFFVEESLGSDNSVVRAQIQPTA
ncbi:hypothetical protein FoTM2_014663 [Fusarium oxysporum f. sp. vasinfectum]|nr:hypothetical protein FoTM2_014663 [Fusarium oxysporum f. sp. vasinfectum]